MTVYTAEPGSTSQEGLRLLASRAATSRAATQSRRTRKAVRRLKAAPPPTGSAGLVASSW